MQILRELQRRAQLELSERLALEAKYDLISIAPRVPCCRYGTPPLCFADWVSRP